MEVQFTFILSQLVSNFASLHSINYTETGNNGKDQVLFQGHVAWLSSFMAQLKAEIACNRAGGNQTMNIVLYERTKYETFLKRHIKLTPIKLYQSLRAHS